MGRLCCWFYASLEQLALDQIFEEPNSPFDKWTILHNQGWLETRGLDKKGLAHRLCERDAKYIMPEGGPPPALTPMKSPVTNVQLNADNADALRRQLILPPALPIAPTTDTPDPEPPPDTDVPLSLRDKVSM